MDVIFTGAEKEREGDLEGAIERVVAMVNSVINYGELKNK